jgi:hypothetical protein
MLPYIVIVAALLFFILKRSGIFENLSGEKSDTDASRRHWGKRVLRELERDPETNKRLEVFKDFLESQQDEDD